MKILHTSDWHIGKKLDRFDRTEEYREVLAEVVAIANREQVDLVVHSGDVFDRAVPGMDDLKLGLDALIELTSDGTRPVVAVAGNHDSPDLFEVLAPFLSDRNVHLVGEIKRPAEGGVLDLTTPGGRAVISCMPFLREGRTFHVWDDPTETHYKNYAEKLKSISQAYAKYAFELAGSDTVTLLTAHFLVGGAKVHGHGAPRGERALHMGEAYAATSHALPSGPQYVAMGHIHAPQPVPGAPGAAEYAGSLLEMDFGEAGETKRVVVVEVEPGLPAAVKSVPVQGGRRLLRPHGTWADIKATDGVYESYLDVTVLTDGPDPGLADRAREEFEFLVKIQAEYPRAEAQRPARSGRALAELYGDYYLQETGTQAPKELVAAFRRLEEEAFHAPA